MLLASLLLLIAAAVLHAIANALMKHARDKLAFVWWMLGAYCILGLPLILPLSHVQWQGWVFVVVSGLLEAVYFLTLTRAYSHGDLSVVYPIARGSAPLFIMLWAYLFLTERPTAVGLAGILIIVTGLYLINLSTWSDWKRPLLGFKSPAVRWAFVTGLLISAYSAVDKKGVTYVPPFLYLYLLLLVCWIAITPQWFSGERRAAILQEIGLQKVAGGEIEESGWRFRSRVAYVVAAALFGTTAYMLVLAAMRHTPVSYVGPVREVSVVFGAWIGVRFMGEKSGSFRLIASCLVALGIILIALKG